ncbi:MAG TPA: hypothetical protein VIY08_00440 [Candidatus Nitrosocosmicus sp.]
MRITIKRCVILGNFSKGANYARDLLTSEMVTRPIKQIQQLKSIFLNRLMTANNDKFNVRNEINGPSPIDI